MQRPDLTNLPDDVVDYIEALEAQIESADHSVGAAARTAASEPSESPTSVNVITITQQGLAKRTPRHHYVRQRRGGMGVFDVETGEDDAPQFLLTVDESHGLLLLTNQGRAVRIPVTNLAETEVRARGAPLHEGLPSSFALREGERFALACADRGPAHANSYLVIVSERGQVKRVSGHLLGEKLQAGTVLHDLSAGGPPAAACWTSGAGDLFIATRIGRAIRFSERQIPVRGTLGLRVEREDVVVAAAGVDEADGVFLLGDDGKGTIRLMSGFSANKSPGAGGKIAMRAEQIVGAVRVAPAAMQPDASASSPASDLFALSRQSKIIRFAAAEVPAKEGVVQGVNCMNLRNDECVALASS